MRRAALLAALATLAGCGDSGPHLPLAVYTHRADAICARYETAIHGLGQPTSITQLGSYIARALPVLERTVAALGAIHPPSERADAYGRFLTAARATVTRARALRAAAGRADAAAVQRTLRDASRASAPRAALARAAGLDACALD